MQPRTIFRLSKYHFQFWTLSGSRYRPPIFYAISVPHRPGATARGDKTSIWSLRLEAIPPRFGTISIPDWFCHLSNAWLSDILCKKSAPFLTTLIARTFKPYKIKDPCWAKSRRELVYCSNRSDIFFKIFKPILKLQPAAFGQLLACTSQNGARADSEVVSSQDTSVEKLPGLTSYRRHTLRLLLFLDQRLVARGLMSFCLSQ